MFAPVRITAVLLAIVTAHPVLASHIVSGAAEPSSEAAAEARGPDAATAPTSYSAPGLSLSLRHVMAASAARFSIARQAMQSIGDASAQQLPGPSIAEQFPMVLAMRRRAGERWNTTDSSRPSDFALCYRFSRMVGLQLIPGDLTPSKLPTPKMLSVKNQGSGMGVLVGMTFRLGRAVK